MHDSLQGITTASPVFPHLKQSLSLRLTLGSKTRAILVENGLKFWGILSLLTAIFKLTLFGDVLFYF
jgi:hypothetical protein